MRTAARALVQVADQDGNGALDREQYARLAAVYGTRAHEAAQAFGRLDQDRNGVLDTAELAEAISQPVIRAPSVVSRTGRSVVQACGCRCS